MTTTTPDTGQTTLEVLYFSYPYTKGVLAPPMLVFKCGWYLVPISYYPALGVTNDRSFGTRPSTASTDNLGRSAN